MKKHFGLVSGTLALALVSAASFGQTPAVAVQAPRVTVSAAPAISTTVAAPTVATTVTAPAIATTIARPAIATTIRTHAVTAPAVVTTVTQPAVAVTVPQVAPAPPPAPAAPPSPPAPNVAVTAPAPAPAPPAPPTPRFAAPAPAPAQEESPQKPTTPPAPPKPAAAPKAPDAPQAPEPMLLAPGRERIDPDPVNIRFEVTIAYQAGTAAPVKRTAVLTVANNTGGGPGFDRASLRSGNNIPVPSTTFAPVAAGGPATNPITSFQYRSVGLNVDVRNAALLPGNRVRATLNVEFSGVDEKTPSTTPGPSFPTFSQSISLYFDNGKPVLVAQSSDVVDNVERKQTVEVKATILR